NTAVGSINDFAKQTQGTLAKVDNVLDGIDPADVRTALANIQKASDSANRAAADIAKVTDKIANRSDDINDTIKNARQLSQRLNDASVRVDGILAKVDKLLGSGEANGVMADARATLKSFKQVADTLNARLGTITDNLARFSGQGLQNVEALVQDSRRSINRIEEAVTDLSRNPQRILTGGEGEVRQFDGRARR
ncbi:MCE family protein, partial [Mesorhizobium sp. M1E.F.Ca.ET.063.01.1.1]